MFNETDKTTNGLGRELEGEVENGALELAAQDKGESSGNFSAVKSMSTISNNIGVGLDS